MIGLRSMRSASRSLLASVLLLAALGCTNALSPYDGPQPSQEDVLGEVVTVRYVRTPVQGQLSFIVDRTRFVEAGDPHNVDRVIMVFTTEATAAQVSALDLQPGDRVTISTVYSGRREVGELSQVPNWPGHRYREYPIATHLFTSAEPVP